MTSWQNDKLTKWQVDKMTVETTCTSIKMANWQNVEEKTCFQNKSNFITEDYFVQHMNITINKV